MEPLLTKMNAVAGKCLKRAEGLLDGEGQPSRSATATVKVLVELALNIGMLNLRYQDQVRSRSSGRVSWDLPSSPQGEEN